MPRVNSVSGDSDDGNGASPYDEPTGAIPIPEGMRTPAGPPQGHRTGVDRDGFYDRHARPGLRRVDDLDDLDPGEVDTVTPNVRGRRQDPAAGQAPVPPPARGPVPDPRWTAPGQTSPRPTPAPVERLTPARPEAPARQEPPARAEPELRESTDPVPVPVEEPGIEPESEITEAIERPAGRAAPQRVGPAKKSRWAAFRSAGSTRGDTPAEPEPDDLDATAAYPAIPSGDAATDPEMSAPDQSTGTDPDAATVRIAAPRNPAPVADRHDDLATVKPTDELTPEPSMAYSAAGPAQPYGLPDAADGEAPTPDPRDAFDPAAADDTAPAEPATTRRGTTDLGLLVLRVAVGAAALAHGLQKLFGWWNGPGLDGFEDFLANAGNPSIGFDGSAAGWLSILGAVSETAGGALLILGLLTPIAASAELGVMLVAATYKVTLAGGLWYFTGAGVGIEYELLLICAALAILLTGPGRIALDYGRGWTTHPKWGSLGLILVSVAAAVTIWVLFNGTNPLTSAGNPV